MRVSEWTRRFRRFIVASKVSCQMSRLGPRKFCDDHNRSIVVRWTNLFSPFRSLFSGGKKEVLLAVSERSYYKSNFLRLVLPTAPAICRPAFYKLLPCFANLQFFAVSRTTFTKFRRAVNEPIENNWLPA